MKPFHALLPMLTALALSCGAQGSSRQPNNTELSDANAPDSAEQSQWAGIWRLARQPPQTRPGFMIEVAFDSVLGGNVYGKLLSFFSGNVGIDPTRYQEFSGKLRLDSALTFTIATHDSTSGRPLFFSGTLTTDTLWLQHFGIGQDTIRSGEWRWFLVRKR